MKAHLALWLPELNANWDNFVRLKKKREKLCYDHFNRSLFEKKPWKEFRENYY